MKKRDWHNLNRRRPSVNQKCRYENCDKILRIRKDSLKIHSGLCKSHATAKKPFESTYNRLRSNARNIPVELTYEQFLEFIKIKNCVYCGVEIVRNATKSKSCFLDRKDSSKSYSKSNCVVCCASCNKIKMDILTYEEMKAAMQAVLKVRDNGS